MKFGGNNHILEGEIGQPPIPCILDICQNILSRDLRDPLRTGESLALKVDSIAVSLFLNPNYSETSKLVYLKQTENFEKLGETGMQRLY